MKERADVERRCDNDTEERVDMAIRTLQAFDKRRAMSYLMLSGVAADLSVEILCRPPEQIRKLRDSGARTERRQSVTLSL
jgi:ssDNA-specific exonuclease RecJ